MHSFAALDLEKLPRDVDALLGVIGELHSQYSTILESLRQQLQNLRRLHFGATSEKLSGQPDLFRQPQELPLPPQDLITVSYKRQRRGRPALPKDLPPKSTAHCYFMLWDWDGMLERLHYALYVA